MRNKNKNKNKNRNKNKNKNKSYHEKNNIVTGNVNHIESEFETSEQSANGRYGRRRTALTVS